MLSFLFKKDFLNEVGSPIHVCWYGCFSENPPIFSCLNDWLPVKRFVLEGVGYDIGRGMCVTVAGL